jgi:predicted ribosomally synthesized peptide with SipW-like signal peptide
MTDDQSQPQLYNLTRRKVLAGLGAVGLASAGAGLGTSAFYQDIESLTASVRAGKVDLFLDYRATYMPWLEPEEFEAKQEVLLGENAAGGFERIPTDDGEGFTDSYAVGQAPDIRDSEGDVLSFGEWGEAMMNVALREDLCGDREFDPENGYTGFINALNADTQAGYTLGDTLGPQGFVNGPEGFMFDLADVKPYDEGEVTMSVHLCGNDSYIYLQPELVSNMENSRNEPEFTAGDVDSAANNGTADPDSGEIIDDFGELADYLHVTLFVDEDCDNRRDEEEVSIYEGSLAGLVALADGGEIPLAFENITEDGQLPGRECFSQGTYCYAFEWFLPCKPEEFEELRSFNVTDETGAFGSFAEEIEEKDLPLDGNVTQSDSLQVRFSYRAEQCRHNMEGIDTSTGEGFVKQEENFNAPDGVEGAFARGRYGNNANNGAWEVGIGTPGPSIADQANYVWTSGATVPFVYQADGSGNASFTLDGVTVSGSGLPPANGRIGIQTKADDSTITVENLQLETDMVQSLNGSTSVASTNDGPGRSTDYLVIETTAADLSNGFTLSGDVTVTLQGDYPGGDEDVAFDVVVE